ncbi:MAG: sn-glycerol-3-phosphate ABC transporter ATP-binding protein UgpC [Sphaerochaetaceae bacterium]|jgi:multiple sugar transport system ATP-binding protein|nr:sn-glycerol-3-phosphate ABC transporter ATP-binding protein UgpC [Sphaerochaetaceae bacterium]MDD3162767.1 sn-glycerol-3-phosphate ABC transporter ATP-binding protein UgpC [Sphaerochaetaceae bacterium]MDD4006986.1 sn-glycerol-3-phosphate ABC transporter ATP-binding protein UgpC [Sphaerochaetaceae bacterium]MDD4397431.1 sn-glycerol-3-phosphate ABC transporter ATP-binding protein UgpC [Sphaerochaetaceae bacterium]
MAEVKLINVCKVYEGNVLAVDKVNIDVKDREFVVLVGPSGCGKSTTLRMIAGLEDISSGELFIDGKLVNDVPPKDRDIAMVFQNYALYPHMTVYENMAFGLKIRKFPKEEIDQRVKEAAKILDIEELLDRKPKALSGGQRQRVAVGRAIVRKPKVFLFDEPLSNLDAKLRVQMRAEISGLHNKLKATMIYVTHDQVEALTMADKIVVMKLGVIQQIGAPLELYNEPRNKFVAGFIGSPPMNFMEVKIEKKADGIYANEGSFDILLPAADFKELEPYVGKSVTMGIRPEDITYSAQPVAGKTIDGTVTVVEPLGSETHVFINTGKNQFVGKIEPSVTVTVDQKASFVPNLDKAKFFDLETELAIRNGKPAAIAKK